MNKRVPSEPTLSLAFDAFAETRLPARVQTVHRILSAEMSTLTFARPKEFDLEKYDEDGRFGFGEGKKIRLTFRIEHDAGQHLMETPLSDDQQVTELDDGKLEITATVVDSAMLEWWLRGFGDAVSHVHRGEQD